MQTVQSAARKSGAVNERANARRSRVGISATSQISATMATPEVDQGNDCREQNREQVHIQYPRRRIVPR